MKASKASSDDGNDTWLALLDWLDTKGFDRNTLKIDLRQSSNAGGGRKLVATQDIYPEQLLISLPRNTLLNYATLVPLYPIPLHDNLTANQLLCLHICLYRHAVCTHSSAEENKDKEAFVPYIRSLPHDFGTVPLWREVLHDDTWRRICKLELLPEALKANTEDVSKRFHEDWRRTSEIWLAHRPASLSGLDNFDCYTIENYLWAWLCVNSRCIWYDLGLPKKEDNITLAPIVDGNHLPRQHVHIMHDTFLRLELVSSNADASAFIKSPPKHRPITHAGGEIFYSYGHHSDHTLLAEYGFVLGAPANSDNNVDVTKRVQKLFRELPEAEREKKQTLLEEYQYWGEYHLQLDTEGKPDVSYRLTIALALLNLALPDENLSESPRKRAKLVKPEEMSSIEDVEAAFAPFVDLVNGETDSISSENERACKASLVRIRAELEKDALNAIATLEKDFPKDDGLGQMLIKLWQTELWFAQEYGKATRADVDSKYRYEP